MTVMERDGSPCWYIKFTYKGHKRRETSGIPIGEKAAEKKASRAQAEELERQWRQDIDDQIAGNYTRGTLGQALEKHLKTTILNGPKVLKAKMRGATPEELLKIKSVASFISAIRVIESRFGSNTPLDEILDVHINGWRDDMLTGGKCVAAKGKRGGAKKATDEGLAKSTINRYLTILKTVMGRAHREWRMLKVMPVFTKLKLHKPDPKALEDHEVDAVLSAAREAGPNGYHTERFLRFLLFTGGRKTESLMVEWPHIDLTSNSSAAVTFISDNAKGSKRRTVEFADGLRQMLREIRAEQTAGGYSGQRVFAYKEWRTGVWIEPTGSTIEDDVAAIQETTGIKDFTLHVCRHTYASRLLRKGRRLEEVRDLLGHASIVTTQIYATFVPKNLGDAGAVLNSDWKQLLPKAA
jgi:integrase